MTDQQHHAPGASARERELEIEVARLQAELDTLRGEDPSTTTSRFLAMAAATVDQVVEDARREADEIVEEVSGQAEARRDEATRVAAEAEAMAEQLLADADRAQERIDAARDEADAIKAAASVEAEALVRSEREKVAVEVEALADVRNALEDERGALERYHEELRSRVQELAETMVTFMSTELPTGTASSIGNLVTPQLESVIAAGATPENAGNEDDDISADEETIVPESEDGTWTDLLEAAIPSDEAYPDVVDMPADAIDEIPDGPPREFAGHEIVEPDDDGRPTSAGLFSRATGDESGMTNPPAPADTAVEDDEDPDPEGAGLFGMLGARLVEQTPPDRLSEALAADESEDEAFHDFLAGDDGPDPSRDWLLRPEKS